MTTTTRYRVLFIDDDEILLASLKNYFAKIGHDVYGETTGLGGIEAYNRVHPDVTVVDLKLPDISGMDVLAELKKRNAMVVMLTGMGEVEHAVEAMRLHAENFLTKPVEMTHLSVAVEKAAEKGLLRKENVELRARLSPTLKKLVAKVGFFLALVAVSALVGMAIGAGSSEDPRVAAPIPVPIDTTG